MEWIDWSGGKCPVSSNIKTEVKYRTGETYVWDDATMEDWLHYADDPEMDIVAYRIVA